MKTTIEPRPPFASAAPDPSSIADRGVKPLQPGTTRPGPVAAGVITERKSVMSHRQLMSLIAIAALGIVTVSADAFARGGGRGGGGAGMRGGGGAGMRGGGAVGVRGGAIANRGAVGVRGGLAYRGVGYGGYPGGYYRPGVGLAAGALVGGAIAASQYGGYGYGGYGYGSGYGYDNSYYGSNPGYAASYSMAGGQDAGYCAQRFKSYDPSTGTYMGYDGKRHPCP
jgi:BA14K-like protein